MAAEVNCPELDLAADSIVRPSMLGARIRSWHTTLFSFTSFDVFVSVVFMIVRYGCSVWIYAIDGDICNLRVPGPHGVAVTLIWPHVGAMAM